MNHPLVSDFGLVLGLTLSILFWMMVVLWEKIEFMKIHRRMDKNGFD